MSFEQSSPEKSGAYIQLRMPCPKCGGKLEKAVVESPGKGQPTPPAEVRCQACRVAWPSYSVMLKEAKFSSPRVGIDDIQGLLRRGKAAVRGGRNVAERIRAVQINLRRAANSIKNIREEGSVEELGDSAENVIDQVILALEDVKDIKKGTLNPFVGGQEPEGVS